jgi:carbon monoxide dehydrogenase subunit G
MEMTGSQLVAASPEHTWQALNTPEVLQACIAGCETFTRVSNDEFQLAMTARVGPVNARLKGKIILTNVHAPQSYTLNFEGQGGAAGFARGSVDVGLVPAEGGTRLTYTAKAQVGGKLAQIGSRLIDGVAKKMADDFFAAFVARLGGVPQAPAPVSVPDSVRAPESASAAKASIAWLWSAGIAVALLVTWFFLSR